MLSFDVLGNQLSEIPWINIINRFDQRVVVLLRALDCRLVVEQVVIHA